MRFNGPCYDPAVDKNRLENQLKKVYALMIDGNWRSLAEISKIIEEPEASVSAQLRHLRKPRFGSYVINKRRRFDGYGLWEYQLLKPLPDGQLTFLK